MSATPYNTTMRVTWVEAGNITSVDSFRIERRVAGTSTWTYVKTIPYGPAPNGYGYTLSGLTNGTRYYVRVGAVYLNGEVEWAPSVTGIPGRPPDAVRSVSVVRGLERLGVTWRPPLYNGGTTVTGYQVYVSTDGVHFVQRAAEIAHLSDGRYGAVVAAPAGQRLWFRVRAVNNAGPGSFDAAPSGVAFTYPGPPRSLRGTPGSRSIALRWLPPASNGGLALAGYEIQVSAWGSDQWRTVGTTSASQLSFTVQGLTNGVAYCVRVASVNTADYGHWAIPIGFYAGSWRAYDPYGRRCYPY